MENSEQSRKPLISVVAPVFDEEENLLPFYNELTATIDSLSFADWEMIFIDDGSTDNSMAQIAALRETDPRVKGLQLSRNFGSHAAITAGLSFVTGDAAVVMSVDLQDPPELIREFVAEWRKGHHIVWGVRETRDDPPSKILLANAFYWLCRRIALPNFPKKGIDCGIFDRKVIDAFLNIGEHHGYLFASIFWLGFRQAEISYHRQARRAGVSKWPLAKRIKAALDIIVSFSYFPIRAISYLGLFISTLSFLYGGFLIIGRLFFNIGGPGWSSMMVVLLFLGGVQLIMLGIIGEYVWRGSEDVKGRPKYVLMDSIGFGQKPPSLLTAPHPSGDPPAGKLPRSLARRSR